MKIIITCSNDAIVDILPGTGHAAPIIDMKNEAFRLGFERAQRAFPMRLTDENILDLFRVFQENDLPENEEDLHFAIGNICGHLLRE